MSTIRTRQPSTARSSPNGRRIRSASTSRTRPAPSTCSSKTLKDRGLLIPVDQAKHTPGALIFHFSSEPVPGGGRPDEAHVDANPELFDGSAPVSAPTTPAPTTPAPATPAPATPTPAATAAAGYAIDPGAPITALDTDHDELTDDREKSIG